jgi:hypothetical protein
MNIRNYRSGDELAQLDIYNQAGAGLTKFKPATVAEVQRRVKARDFDPDSRFYAEVDGKVVGYANYSANGRVSYPWTLPGHDQVRQPLWDAMLQAMKRRGQRKVFAAYREDWSSVHQFFLEHGFRKARDVVNFVVDLVDMPTPAARPSLAFSPLKLEDLPAVLDLAPEVLRIHEIEALRRYLFQNPYFPPESLFVSRSRSDRSVIAVGILITDSTYADPKMVDASMPCYRLGAFGTEGMQTKRIKGLFSLLAKQDGNLKMLGMDLLGQACSRLRDNDELESLAGQAPSDAPALLDFYTRNFRKQGSFPVFERELT